MRVMKRFDYVVVGGGIVGLATAAEILRRRPRARLAVIEKERRWAAHQSGRNSGVIHSGIYYRPGSLKAELAVRGSRSMVAFCRERGIAHDVCGKVIVATREPELPLLEVLLDRAQRNGTGATRLDPDALREREPAAAGIAAIHVHGTGICDYRAVCESLAAEVARQGGEAFLGTRVVSTERDGDAVRIVTTGAELETKFLVACAGLQSDLVAAMDGVDPGARIVPFRGEYYELVPEKRHLVHSLIYPVPDPAFPFLGVHLTKMHDGSVHAGPNAVLSFRREGYRRTSFSAADTLRTFAWPGFWRLAARHGRAGMGEMYRSFSRGAFVKELQRLLPAVGERDLVPAEAGVRAQALRRDGTLVDDFLFVRGERSLHVCNAPSPAATASLEIARVIADEAGV
jgi:(S)-2-hydroxyglutarate dehydrogenase